jgi:GNAT superfamily N-acetyltransferase
MAATDERRAEAGFGDLSDDVPLETLHAVFGFIDAAVADAAPGQHWHLNLLAVEPEQQGRGLGTALVRHGLDRAAETGHDVVLETFAEGTVTFYLRNGFELLTYDVEPVSELPFWALRSAP